MGWPLCFDHVFRRLKGVVSSGKGGWYAFCPAHDDKHGRSLSLAIGREGRLLVRCHAGAGCPTASILGEIGLNHSDLYPDNEYHTGARFKGGAAVSKKEAVRATGTFDVAYPYHDEDGVLLYEVVRFRDPKEFRQRRPNPDFDRGKRPSATNKQWLWSLGDVRRVPYRLRELIADLAARPKEPVALVEGEKDVDNLRAAGVIATTVPGGAGKFAHVRDHLRKLLAGRRVAVIADDDPVDERTGFRPGLKHATDCCQGLFDVAETVKLVTLYGDEQGKDASDFLAEGNDRMAFWRRVSLEPVWAATAGDADVAARQAHDGVLFSEATVTAVCHGGAAERLARAADRLAAKHRPVENEDEAVGRMMRYVTALADAQNEGNRDKFLDILATASAFASLACDNLSAP
jgi:hypothetical protein